MKVLVTGATGFVGASLARRLVNGGYDTHILLRPESDRWRIADLAGRLTEHRCDLRDAAAVDSCVSAVRPEVICHTAAYGGFASQTDSLAIVEANLIGTMNLLRACGKSGFRLFINTGSSSEYGLKDRPMREDDLPEPVGDYGVAKAAATLFCQAEALTKGLQVVTLRLFSPYGPWDDPKRLIPYAAATLLRGESPRLSSPDSVRDYVYIDDVLDCYLALIEGKGAVAGIINVGSGEQTAIGKVVAELERLAGGNARGTWGERPAARPEPAIWSADVTKARQLLGWEPRTSLTEGLCRTVAWMRTHLELYHY